MIAVLRPDQPDYRARLEALCRRTTEAASDVEEKVAQILADVRSRGDDAVRELTERFDQRAPGPDGSYELSPERWDARAAEVAPAGAQPPSSARPSESAPSTSGRSRPATS